MGKSNFNRLQCLRALRELGFTKDNIRRGEHDKYNAPANIGIQPGKRPFIMIPRHGELRCQLEILQELRTMGGKELESSFIENL